MAPSSNMTRPSSTRTVLGAVLRLALAFAVLVAPLSPATAQSRIKDIADVEGVRDNMLVGYGLVVGLKGSGDRLKNAVFTKETLIGMLARLGVNTRDNALDAKNIAAVMVTATLPPFSRQGSRIDVNVSALGDASSLLGGTLLVTPLLGADSEVYAVAQGQVAVSGFEAKGAASSISKGVPTGGRISSGAIIERELDFDLQELTSLKLALRNPDFTTAQRIGQAINAAFGGDIALPLDPGTVQLTIPPQYRGRNVEMLTMVEQLRVTPDQVAKVVIDERSGIIVMGENVRISTVAIAQGNLTIRITETPQVSQPQPFGQGQTAVVPRTDVQVDEDSDRKLSVLNEGVSLQELVDGLNALGIGPRDMITICLLYTSPSPRD